MRRLIEKIWRRFRLILSGGTVVKTDGNTAQVSLLPGEVKDSVPIMFQYGFRSVPPNESKCLVLSDGERDSSAIIASAMKKERDEPKTVGIVEIFHESGPSITLDADRVEVKAGEANILLNGNKITITSGKTEVVLEDGKVTVNADEVGITSKKFNVTSDSLVVGNGTVDLVSILDELVVALDTATTFPVPYTLDAATHATLVGIKTKLGTIK